LDLTKVRHALVTGGASGIGLGVVNAFVERGIAVTAIDIIPDEFPQSGFDQSHRRVQRRSRLRQ
jgi:NAD(P)-dependent dehydrogenase (short-subunit alcohol dehydrogenase family)